MQTELSLNQPRVGILITKPNHHWAMIRPVICELLAEQRVRPIVISLCGLRRMVDPVQDYRSLGLEYRCGPDLTRLGLKTSSGQDALGGGASINRRIIQGLAWSVLLKPTLVRKLFGLQGLLMLNDQAFPANRLTKAAKSRGMWTGMLQEGIRFPLPNESTDSQYACSNLDVLFVWGQQSATYFADKLRAFATRIVISGNPRYYELLRKDWSVEAQVLREQNKTCGPVIGIATNPIDDQGFCNSEQKWNLLRKFLAAATAALRPVNGQLWIKCHPRESQESYQKLIGELGCSDVARSISSTNIFPFLQAIDRTVVLASTVGLESLAMNKPLAVLPVPGHGYVHDYVESKAALALHDDCMKKQIIEWLGYQTGINESLYVVRHLSNESNPSRIIKDWIVNALVS